MKRIIFLALSALVFSCAPGVYITGSWAGSRQRPENIKGVFVAALTNDIVLKSAFERDLASELKRHDYAVAKSIDEFPPEFLKDSTDRKKLLDRLKEKKLDAILAVSVLRKENDFRYIPGGCTYYPMMYVHYHYFWGYYSYWYPCVYSPGYYVNEINYFLESNLYDGRTGELMWSAQSKTYSIQSICSITAQFSKEVVSRMITDGVLRQNAVAVPVKNEQARN